MFLSLSEPVSSFSENGDRTDSLETGNSQLWAISRALALIPLWGLSDLALGFWAPLTKGLYPTPYNHRPKERESGTQEWGGTSYPPVSYSPHLTSLPHPAVLAPIASSGGLALPAFLNALFFLQLG